MGNATYERWPVDKPVVKENVRKHFIDRLTPRQLEEVRDAFTPIVDYLRKIRDRD